MCCTFGDATSAASIELLELRAAKASLRRASATVTEGTMQVALPLTLKVAARGLEAPPKDCACA